MFCKINLIYWQSIKYSLRNKYISFSKNFFFVECNFTSSNKEVLKNEDGLYIHSESVGKVYFYFPIYDSNTGYLSGNIKVDLTANDILKLAEEIKNKQNKVHFLDYVSDNLPF